MFWLIIGSMLAIAILFVATPLFRAERRLSATIIAASVVIAAISAGLYTRIGTPNADVIAAASTPDVDEMVASLAARLEENPDDLSGWKMLGRSHLQLGNFLGAVKAYEEAVRLDSGQDGQTLADLGEAVLLADARALNGRAGGLFENALAISPNNPKALFYSGMAAVERGDNELGASRWEALLATSPPPNIAGILQQRIAELRGTAPQAVPGAESADSAAVVNVAVSLGERAAAAGLADATVFIIARDPAQPSPPIAAVRRRLSELPATVSIGDADAMIPGRVPSGFGQLELVARISLSGQPIAQPGDWFGQQIVDTAGNDTIEISIDQQVTQ